jgi:large subunit ribosomal protein L17
MRHKKTGRKLGRDSSSRKALFRNLSISLLNHEIIRTTLPKAKELRKFVEPLITLAKHEFLLRDNSNHVLKKDFNRKIVALRRKAFSFLRNRVIVKKLFERFATRCNGHMGGYLRIVKCGYRFGDKSPMAFIRFVDFNSVSNEKR